MSNRSHRLYIGATSDLFNRVREHRERTYESSFTARYTFNRLVYFEVVDSKQAAIRREQQLKKWSRAKKVAMIQAKNPNWYDLSMTLLETLCLA